MVSVTKKERQEYWLATNKRLRKDVEKKNTDDIKICAKGCKIMLQENLL